MTKTAKIKRVARDMAKQAAIRTYESICNESPENIKQIARLAAAEAYNSIVRFSQQDPVGQPVTPTDPKPQPFVPPQAPVPAPDQLSADDGSDEEEDDEDCEDCE